MRLASFIAVRRGQSQALAKKKKSEREAKRAEEKMELQNQVRMKEKSEGKVKQARNPLRREKPIKVRECEKRGDTVDATPSRRPTNSSVVSRRSPAA